MAMAFSTWLRLNLCHAALLLSYTRYTFLGCRSRIRTPGIAPPFSSMNSTPAIARGLQGHAG
jgi:hypothetical protein